MGSNEESRKVTCEEPDIAVVEFPECVRIRTEMYLSDKAQAIDEIVSNSVDEYLAERCNYIQIIIDANEKVSVLDNGGGIPITKHKNPSYAHLSQAEVAFTTLHAGGKFGQEKGGYKNATGGLHGVGASCVNATSSWMLLTVYKNKKIYEAEFSKGIITKNLKQVQTYETDFTGTQVEFVLDEEIWGNEKIDYKQLRKRLCQLAYLNTGLTIDYTNELTQEKEVFYYEQGAKAYVEATVKESGDEMLCTPIYTQTIANEVKIQFACTYTNSFSSHISSFCNNIHTEAGGDHLIGFNQGICTAICDYAIDKKIIKEDEKFENSDCLEGLYGIVSVIVSQPKFEGQSKSKIKMRFIRNIVKDVVYEAVFSFLDHNPSVAQIIMSKIQLSQKARLAAQHSRDMVRKNKKLITGKAKKLKPCSEKDPALCEIYIVEGDSAGGTAGNARNREIQAILPIFGKILNAEKADDLLVVDNKKLEELVKALECGIGEDFDVTKVRYHKIILLADGDVDGGHIVVLFLTFLYRFYRPLIEAGYVYVATPPLFSIKHSKDDIIYVLNEEKRDEMLAQLLSENKKVIEVKRYKGLGEMNPEQLWETTLNPANRTLLQITLEDAEKAEEMLQICMGKAVPPRKAFIETNAQYAKII